jgi:indole-3-glycerol phosphate synthase
MNYLDSILEHKREEIVLRKARMSTAQLQALPAFLSPPRPFARVLAGQRPGVIAEVKKASPSKQVIRRDFDPTAIAAAYAEGGAHALSVLTDERFFQGSLEYLAAIRNTTVLPLLRKDFILDPYQLYEAKAFGADAVLLIAAALGREQLRDLQQEAAGLGLETLVEVHTEEEMIMLGGMQMQMVGINNRNLSTFETDLTVSFRLKPLAPPGVLLVSESGIRGGEDVRALARHGIHAVLIGETFMRAPDPGAAVRELIAASQDGAA